jgi:predicted RNase H-like nuclease (RuvC/YqgF family)
MHPLDDAADLVKYWETPLSAKWEAPSECCTAPTLTTDNSVIERIDKHVDELEEDIEFFNKQLKEQEEKVANIKLQQDAQVAAIEAEQGLHKMKFDSEIERLEAKIEHLEDKVDKLNEALIYLNNNLNNLGGT